MTLTIADIDQWDPEAVAAVGTASGVRAESATETSSVLGALPAFTTWSGDASQAASVATSLRRTVLDEHGLEAAGIASAASTAATEVAAVKQQLADVRSTAGLWGITIDSLTGQAQPPLNYDALSLPQKLLMPVLLEYTQYSADLVREAADKADELLAAVIEGRSDEVSTGKHAVWEDSVEGEHTFDNGLHVEGDAGAEVLSAEAGADYEIGLGGVNAGANANATLAAAEANGAFDWGILSGSAGTRVAAEANAEADASITSEGVDVGAEAFIGARATVEGEIDVAGVGLAAEAEAWAGAGAAADANIGYEDGKIKVGAELGLAWGIGAKYGFDLEIDPGEVVDTVKDKVGSFFGSIF